VEPNQTRPDQAIEAIQNPEKGAKPRIRKTPDGIDNHIFGTI